MTAPPGIEAASPRARPTLPLAPVPWPQAPAGRLQAEPLPPVALVDAPLPGGAGGAGRLTQLGAGGDVSLLDPPDQVVLSVTVV
jgi:hypothetical protein